MIVSVGVVGSANQPLFIQHYDPTVDVLSFHYLIHTSLDVVEEKVKEGQANNDQYLGFLGPLEEYRLYAHVTNTKVKFILVLDEAPQKESDLKTVFVTLHQLFVDTMSNPFARLDEPITSQKFQTKVETLVQQYNKGGDISRTPSAASTK